MEKINLSDWTQFSTRAYSKSYKSKDGRWMIKADHSEFCSTPDTLLHEQIISKAAYEIGVPTPAVGEVVMLDDGYYGLIYEYIEDKKSFSRAISENPEKLEEYTERFAAVTKKMHEVDADFATFPSVESIIAKGLKTTPIFTEAEKEIILRKLDDIPKSTKCLHGDMTPANAILSSQGDFIIDLGTMAYGHPYYDVGYLLHMARYCSDELSNRLFHFGADVLKKFWKLFVKYYFGTEDCKAVEAMLEPYSRLGCLCVLQIFSTPDTVYAAKEHILSPDLMVCPVCGQYNPDVQAYDICPVCAWEADPLQFKYPDLDGGANRLSLNNYRRKYYSEIKKTCRNDQIAENNE